MKRRLISTVLVVAVLCSMICIAPSASAVTPWEHFVEVLGQSALNFGQVDFSMSDFIFPITGECTEEDLLFAQDRYNSWLATTLRTGSMIGSAFDAFFNTHRAIIVEDTVNNRRRLQDGTSGEWIVDYSGKYPYVSIASNDTVPDWATKPAPDCPSAPEFSPKTENSWLELAPIQTKLNSGLLSGNTSYNYNQLTDLLNGLRDRGPNVNYRLAPVFGGSYGVCKNNLVLCDVAGRPFIAFKEEASSAANQTQNVYVKNDGGGDLIVGGDKVTTDIKILDKSENTMTIPVTNDNSTNVTIDNLIHQNIYDTSYNFDDHSYTVNTYDVTYNNDNRRYETNYYTWNITYNITNTYVTYIGSNDAYQQKAYEFYYELPDGRSSADLTADEVAAMSFQFADVMNYQRSATDTNLRALYHFDGDLSDSGYFSDKTSFTWKSGASITYMDSSVFDGALYLDDTSHSFDIWNAFGEHIAKKSIFYQHISIRVFSIPISAGEFSTAYVVAGRFCPNYVHFLLISHVRFSFLPSWATGRAWWFISFFCSTWFVPWPYLVHNRGQWRPYTPCKLRGNDHRRRVRIFRRQLHRRRRTGTFQDEIHQ